MNTMPGIDPVFEDDNKWYFYDETWANYYGPYDTEFAARTALKKYCKEVLG